MACPACGSDELRFSVPPDYRAYLPEDRPAVAVCTRCLHVSPADAADESADGEALPDFAAVSDAFPPDREQAAGVVVVLALLDRLAVHRSELNDLIEQLEWAGVDVLLVVDRLRSDPDLEPHLDLDRRRTQLEQLLY